MEGRHRDHDRPIRAGAERAQDVEAVQARHVEIEQQQSWMIAIDQLERLHAVGGAKHLVPFGFQHQRDELADLIVVFGNDDAELAHRRALLPRHAPTPPPRC